MLQGYKGRTHPLVITESDLRDLYISKDMSIWQIAKKLDISDNTIHKYLNSYGISRKASFHSPKKLKIDPGILRNLYIEQFLPITKISKILDISKSVLYRALKEFNILQRSPSAAKLPSNFNGVCLTCNKQSKVARCKSCSDRDSYLKHKEERLRKSRKYRKLHSEVAREYAKKYLKENRQRLLEYKKLYGKTHRAQLNIASAVSRHSRRAKYKKGTLTVIEWREILVKQDGKCCYCKKETKLTMDHIIPLSRGGEHSKENVAGACWPCNMSKRSKLVSEWFGEQNG